MLKYIRLVLLFLVLVPDLNAQDLIILRNGDEILAKVSEIQERVIKYKRYDNLSGPTYTADRSELFMIKFENGTKEVFVERADSNEGISSYVATFYFYRPRKFASSGAKIIIGTSTPDEVVLKLKNGSWFKIEYPHLGERDFMSGVYVINPEFFTLTVEEGQTYYVRCTILTKGFKVMSELEMVDRVTAEEEMKGLKEQVKTFVNN